MTSSTQPEGSAVERARAALLAASEAHTNTAVHVSGAADHARGLAAVRDAQVASGLAMLAVAEELAAARAEGARVAHAVEFLAMVLPASLTNAAQQVDKILDEGLGEVATTVGDLRAELVTVLADRPRRSWWARMRGDRS